jgi:hypothetical protein
MSESRELGLANSAPEPLSHFTKDAFTRAESVQGLVEMIPQLADNDLFRARELMDGFTYASDPAGGRTFRPNMSDEMKEALKKVGTVVEDELFRRRLTRAAP